MLQFQNGRYSGNIRISPSKAKSPFRVTVPYQTINTSLIYCRGLTTMIDESPQRAAVLDPVDRVSEIIFGVLMALTFSGTLSVATAGREEVRTMMLTALGCNIAWGLTDAVMYLIRTFTERRRKVRLLNRLRTIEEKSAAYDLIAGALPPLIAANAPVEVLDILRRRLITCAVPGKRLVPGDYVAALGIFLLVVLATFPVVLPFIFVTKAALALRLSNLLAVCTLFVCGYALGHHTTEKAWPYGLALTAIGCVLVGIIIALGG
jgi:VIT1/CCC1 family predicted Fe2+/Mn2+ transporter